MKFELSDSFHHFFAKNNLIEFENVFSSDELNLLSSKLQNGLKQALNGKPIEIASNKNLWEAGRNLWMKDPSIQRMLTKSSIGSIASFLFKKRPLRLGYSQSIFNNASDHPFSDSFSLATISSMTPVLGGACLCFNSPTTYDQEDALPDLARQRAGRIIFFSAEHLINFPSIFSQNGLHCLLLCFVPQKPRYKHQPLDVHTHELKKSGYVFGDILGEKEVPYLYH